MLVTDCARDTVRRDSTPPLREFKTVAAHIKPHPRRSPEQHQYAQPRIRRLDPALLAQQPAPDCEYKRTDLKTVDPDEWARLKAEYERQCYQDAEKKARERLGLLQASLQQTRD
jgi:predicted secreted Zn-dependent protease